MHSPTLCASRSYSFLPLGVAGFLAAITLVGTSTSLSAQAVGVTKTAQANPVPVAGGGFELSSTQQAYNPNWPGWSFTAQSATGGSGIANNGSQIVGISSPAPEGTAVAFLEGRSALTSSVTVAPGRYRLRFSAAQRNNGTVSNQQLIVLLNGTNVFQQNPEDTTFRDYYTLPINTQGAIQIGIYGAITGLANAALVDFVQIDPVLNWSNGNSWLPAGVPSANDRAFVPDDAHVMLDSAAIVQSLQVQGDFEAAPTNCSLRAEWVLVEGVGSSFCVGSPTQPFAQDFQLTLAGTNRNDDPLGGLRGTKFFMARNGGQISLHGEKKTSWTKLNEIQLGGLVIGVDDHTGWNTGDEIVVAYTGYVSHLAPLGTSNPYQGPRSQVRTIDQIAATGELVLNQTIVPANHCAAPANSFSSPSGAQTWQIDQRAEVGMLSHNVRVVAVDTSSTSAGNTFEGFGGHVMLMAGGPNMPPGEGRFSSIELRNLGQHRELGRYPMHWHMQRDTGYGQFMRDSSVRDSFNRAITIHGSHGVSVERNVCFNIEGHAVFLEDGVEQGNQLIGNLVLATQKPDEPMLLHDNSLDEPQNRSPAAFWISHPNNHVTGNVAADSLGTGYWFALHQSPTGLSASQAWINSFSDQVDGQWVPWNARRAPLGSFADNVSHSCKMGVDVHDTIDDAGTPTDALDDDIVTNRAWDPPTVTDLLRFQAYGCTAGIYTGATQKYHTKIRFRDCVLTDNGLHVQFAAADTVMKSLFVHDNGNQIYPPSNATYVDPYEQGTAYVVYDGPGSIVDSHLVGYGPNGANMVYSDFGAALLHTNHVFSGLTYEEGPGTIPNLAFQDFTVPPLPQTPNGSGVWGIAIQDPDGSIYPPQPGLTLVTNHEFMHLVDANGWSPDIPVSATAWMSPFKWGHLQVRYYAGPQTNVLLTRGDVPAVAFRRLPFDQDGNGPLLPYNQETYIVPRGGSQMQQLPVIAKRAGTNDQPCVYELVIFSPWPDQTTLPLNRVDISLDDVAAGDEAFLVIGHRDFANWSPSLYFNDDPETIHYNGQNPSTTTLPIVPMAASSGTTYSLQRSSMTLLTQPRDIVRLKLSNPGRTHRITITW